MGYRSEVKIAVYGDNEKFDKYVDSVLSVDALKAADAEYLLHEDRDFASLTITQLNEHEKIAVLEFHDIKWYESYPDIQLFERFYLEAEENGLNSEYARVGESHDDNEVVQYGDDLRYVLDIDRSVRLEF